MGLVSKREALQNQEKARQTKTKVLDNSLPELQIPAASLRNIVESYKARTNANALDITHGSMSFRTAEGVYITLLKGLKFLVGYFRHIRHPELLHLILVKMLNDSLAEAFFSHLTEMIPGNNLTFMQMARLAASEAFHYLLIVLSSSENVGISIRRSRDEHPGTYFYSSTDNKRDDDAGELLWLFFNAKHETLFTTEDLRRAKRNDDEGLSKMLCMGKMDVCESFLSKSTTNETTAEEKAALRAVTMATKSRKMKTLRDFQKRRYCTAPTIIGQHSHRLVIDIPELPTRFLHDNDFVDEDDLPDQIGTLSQVGTSSYMAYAM